MNFPRSSTVSFFPWLILHSSPNLICALPTFSEKSFRAFSHCSFGDTRVGGGRGGGSSSVWCAMDGCAHWVWGWGCTCPRGGGDRTAGTRGESARMSKLKCAASSSGSAPLEWYRMILSRIRIRTVQIQTGGTVPPVADIRQEAEPKGAGARAAPTNANTRTSSAFNTALSRLLSLPRGAATVGRCVASAARASSAGRNRPLSLSPRVELLAFHRQTTKDELLPHCVTLLLV